MLAVQHRFGCRRIVYDETSHAFPSDREGLKRENVYSAIGKRFAGFSKRAWPIFHQYGEFFGYRHSGNLHISTCTRMQAAPEWAGKVKRSYASGTKRSRPAQRLWLAGKRYLGRRHKTRRRGTSF